MYLMVLRMVLRHEENGRLLTLVMYLMVLRMVLRCEENGRLLTLVIYLMVLRMVLRREVNGPWYDLTESSLRSANVSPTTFSSMFSFFPKMLFKEPLSLGWNTLKLSIKDYWRFYCEIRFLHVDHAVL